MLYFFVNSALNTRSDCLSASSVKTTYLALPTKSPIKLFAGNLLITAQSIYFHTRGAHAV
jgi:hypothetical protein